MSRTRRFGGHGEGEDIAESELNLVPYLDIMVNLIMFMLVTVSYLAQLKVIDIVAPNYGADASGKTEKSEPERSLTLAITESGYTILSNDPTLGRFSVPMAGGDFDYRGLTSKLSELKSQHKISNTLVVVAAPQVAYAAVVKTLDAARADGEKQLFPDVALGQVYGGK
ncbi:biopolymer transporter ExbD [Myxococcota bacterium]|nr:biopolymer transporter ExbD [Myxococcota bacterium]